MQADWLLVPIDLVLVVLVARAGGALAARIGQPPIAGQLLTVVLLGPTVLGGRLGGRAAAGVAHDLFPPLSVDVLTWVGDVGLVVYMLLVGLAVDSASMRSQARRILIVAGASIAATVPVAIVAGVWLASSGGWKADGVTTGVFIVALIGALSAHGVPVVARVLEDRGELQTGVGATVIAAGACASAVSLVLAGAAMRGAPGAGAIVPVGALVLACVVAARVTRGDDVDGPNRAHGAIAAGFTVGVGAVLVVLACAVVAGLAGRALLGTLVIGPLLVGVLANGRGAVAQAIDARVGDLVRMTLLPVFLAVAGLHANLRDLGVDAIVPVAALLVALSFAKVAAGYGAARASGFAAADARAIGVLLQCGGILTIAISLDLLDANIVTGRTHALLALIGLVTTVVVGPLLGRRPAPAPKPAFADG